MAQISSIAPPKAYLELSGYISEMQHFLAAPTADQLMKHRVSLALDQPVATVAGARTYVPTEVHFETAKAVVPDQRSVQTL